MNSKKINDYLWHGYLPPTHIPEWIWRDLPEPPSDVAYTPAYASHLFDRLFDRLCAERTGPHLVPISGGWDSRLILGALRERLSASEIITVSYGSPGQLDYDVGANVAAALDVRHIPIDLSQHYLEWEGLAASCNDSPWTYVPMGYYESLVRKVSADIGARSHWTGFLGGPLTGGHSSTNDGNSSTEELKGSFSQSQLFSKVLALTEPGFLPDYPSVHDARQNASLPGTEWYDFCVRQRACVAPIVLPQTEWDAWSSEQGTYGDGCAVVTPFADSEWASYWLNCPRELHLGQKLYLDMARNKFPNLFALPSKYTFGARPGNRIDYYRRRYSFLVQTRLKKWFPRMGMAPKLLHNYIDFDEAFRVREDYRRILDSAISFLKQEEVVPWIDLDGIVSDHMNRKAHHGRALLVLVGLAANLCAEQRLEDQSVRQTI